MTFRDWRPGSRLIRIRASHTYGYVLVLIVATYLLIVVAPDGNVARATLIVVESGTLAMALWTSGLDWVRRGVVLIAVGSTAAVLQLVVGGERLSGFVALLAVLFVLATIAVIGIGVFDQRVINRQSVTGAICIYLFIGILFTFLYGADAELKSGPLFAQSADGTPAIRIYFSYVTLATLGYGDYTPAGQPGRSFAIAEALLGQLYLVTVVALLVGRLRVPDRDGPTPRQE